MALLSRIPCIADKVLRNLLCVCPFFGVDQGYGLGRSKLYGEGQN